MILEMLAFGLWPVDSSTGNGHALKAVFAVAFVFGLAGLALAAAGAIYQRMKAPKPSNTEVRVQALEATEAQLENELAILLRFMRTYVEANDSYSKSLAQVHRNLHALAKPEQVRALVKFLIAENEKMQRQSADLERNLEHSRSQIEKLRWNLAEAQELGLRDPLTSLSNRRCFDINLAKEIEDAHQHHSALCLVMGDIDRFKTINDTFGHQIGDEILKMFAKLLSSNVKGRDTVARFGGEEFAIILPETKLGDAERLTENIRHQLASKELAVNNSGEPIGRVTASFGVAQLENDENADSLVQRADSKLYEAKCSGRNCVIADRPVAA